jgi:hypothetical protein
MQPMSLVKNSEIPCQLTKFFFTCKKFNILNFLKFMAIKKARQIINSPPTSFFVLGSGIRDGINQDPLPGSEINIPDPQHFA